jgi:hypothetical protein
LKGGWYEARKHGHGTESFPSQGSKEKYTYIGEFKDDKYNGHGTITFPNGDSYLGEWKDGEFHGQGKYFYRSGPLKGGSFEGNYVDGTANGQGTFTMPNGTKGVGIFKGSKPVDVNVYDKNGNLIEKYLNGKKIKP